MCNKCICETLLEIEIDSNCSFFHYKNTLQKQAWTKHVSLTEALKQDMASGMTGFHRCSERQQNQRNSKLTQLWSSVVVDTAQLHYQYIERTW